MFGRLRELRHQVRRNTRVSYLALRDPRTPWYVKGLAAAMALYAINPIDIIPDFIPLHGVLDDVLAIPVTIALMVHLIPAPLKSELTEKAEAQIAAKRSRSRIPEVIILICLAGIVGIVVWLMLRA